MSGMDERQELSSAKIEMLSAMGITYWHLRRGNLPQGDSVEAEPVVSDAEHNSAAKIQPATVDPSVVAQAVPDSHVSEGRSDKETGQANETVEASPAVDPLAFAWIKGAFGMLLISPGAQGSALQLAKDVVVYADWLHRQNSQTQSEVDKNSVVSQSTQPAVGDFRWPQLLDSGGTPARSLAAFFEKHLGEQALDVPRWLVAEADVVAQITPWLPEQLHQLVEVPQITGQLCNAAEKKRIWSSLQKRQ